MRGLGGMRFLTLVFAILLLTGCASSHRTVSLWPIETRTAAAMQAMADELPGGVRASNPVELIRVAYWTTFKGRPVQVSGLIAMPRDTPVRGVVAYLHGTTTTRSMSPSLPGRVDGDQEAAVFAANGFIVVLPDYVGLGSSEPPQAYLVARPQVDVTLDLLKIVREGFVDGPESQPTPLFVMGFSQGGQSAAAVHRAIEQTPLAGYVLKATVAVAGPHDLAAAVRDKLAPPAALDGRNVAYLAFAGLAYANYYDRPLDQVFQPQSAVVAPNLFDGAHSPEQIVQGLPQDARALFQPAVLNALIAGEGWLAQALAENETWRWTPRAPLRIVVGERDQDVPPAASQALYDYAAANGGAVTLTVVSGADHMAAAASSYAPALSWFESLAPR